jgi:hypothetical protein
LSAVSGDDVCSQTREHDATTVAVAHAGTPGSVVARAFVTAAQGLSLDKFFDQTMPIESLVN